MRSFPRVTLRLQRYQRWAPPTLRFLLSHALPLFLGRVSLTSTRRSRMHTDRPGRDAPQSHGAEGLPTGTTRPVTAGIRRAPCLAVWPHTAGGRFEGGIGMPRVFAVRSALSWCQRGTLRLIAVITQGEVIRQILRHRTCAADPPPIAPVCARHASCDWVASGHDDTRGLVSHVRAVAGVAHLRVCALPAQGTPLRLLPLPPARRGGSWWPAGGAGRPAPRRTRALDFLSASPPYIGRLCRRCSGRGRHVRQWMSVGSPLARGRHQGRRNCATSSKLGEPIEALAAAHDAMPAAVIKVDDTPMHAAPPSHAPLHQRRRDLRALDLRPPSPTREQCDAYAAGCAVEPCPLYRSAVMSPPAISIWRVSSSGCEK